MREPIDLNNNPTNQKAKEMLTQLPKESWFRIPNVKYIPDSQGLYLLKLLEWFLTEKPLRLDNPSNEQSLLDKVWELQEQHPKEAWTWLHSPERQWGQLTGKVYLQAKIPETAALEAIDHLRMLLFDEKQEAEEMTYHHSHQTHRAHLPPLSKDTPRLPPEKTRDILTPEQRELVDDYVDAAKKRLLEELKLDAPLDVEDQELFDALQTELNSEDALTEEQALLIDEYEQVLKEITIEELEANLDRDDQELLSALKADTPLSADEDVVQKEIKAQHTPDTEKTKPAAKTVRPLTETQSQQQKQPTTEKDILEIVKNNLQARIGTQDKARYALKTEYTIRVGRSGTVRADLVLLRNDTPLVIAECKRPRIVGGGKEQLESYLNLTRTRLGIFANDPDPDNWIYYDTIIGFNEIPCQVFNRRFQQQLTTERDIEAEAARKKELRIEARANQLVTQKAVTERTDKLIEEKAKAKITENAIQDSIAEQLKQQIKRLKNENSRLTEKISNETCSAIWGWSLFVIAVVLLIVVASN